MPNTDDKYRTVLLEGEETDELMDMSKEVGGYMGEDGDGEVLYYTTSSEQINSQIPKVKDIYTITVTNTDLVDHDTVLFGAAQFLQTTNFGNVAGITVNVQESSYQKLLNTTQFTPFEIVAMKLISTSAVQLTEPMRYTYENAAGYTDSYVLQVEPYFLTRQFQAIIRMLQPIKFKIDGDAQFNFTTRALTSVVVTVYANPICQPQC